MTLTLYKVIFFSQKKSNYNQRKRNFKLGLANHIALNMENEKKDNKKSKNSCDHSKYKQFINASWVNIFKMRLKKYCYWVIIILLPKTMMNNQSHPRQ